MEIYRLKMRPNSNKLCHKHNEKHVSNSIVTKTRKKMLKNRIISITPQFENKQFIRMRHETQTRLDVLMFAEIFGIILFSLLLVLRE